MRLHSIKLSGFKSFADATTVSFPAQLAGVVGPNGSGKSNIVDAIRLVLGERSARELRGGQISDVIFNGSSTRQASSAARIELLFENAYGKLKGDYARFNEISVAREVDSEGQSSFFINNVRARRRDVVDCFLGTGLGPRSYAIIQQGTVSRLVESKPEELRQHLEEVAGISLYRERRHETGLRLKNTRDNLSRLLDTAEELDKHLRQLKRQAKNAKKYRTFKSERDGLHNMLVVARWRELEKRIAHLGDQAGGNRTRGEDLHAELASGEAELAGIQSHAEEVQQQIDQHQQKYYELKQLIALAEQQMGAIESRKENLQEDMQQAEQQRMQLASRHSSDQAELADLVDEIARLNEEMCNQQQALQTQTADLQEVEKDHQRLQSAFQQSQQENFELQKKLELLRYQINENEQQLHLLQEKHNALVAVDPQFADQHAQLAAAATSEQQGLDQLHRLLQQTESVLNSKREQHERTAAKHKAQLEQLHQLERELRQAEGRMESLQTLIENKTGQTGEKINSQALAQLGLKPMLRQLKVQKGWEAAVELAFASVVRGYVSPDADLSGVVKELEGSGISLGYVAASSASSDSAQQPQGLRRFDSIVSGAVPQWMSRTWFADTIEDALAQMDRLDDYTIVCKDGSIVSRDWLTLGRPPEGETLVSLQQRLDQTTIQVNDAKQQHVGLEKTATELENTLVSLRGEIDGLEEDLRARQQDAFNTRSRLERIHYQQSSAESEQQQRAQALEEIAEQSKKLRNTIASLKQSLTGELEKQEQLQQSHGDVHNRHSYTSERVESLRARVKEQSDAVQSVELALGKAQTRHDVIVSNIETIGGSLKELTERIERDNKQVEELAQQPQALREQLNTKVSELADCEDALTGLRQQLSDYKHQASQAELGLRARRSQIEQQRDALQQLELQMTEARTRAQSQLEQLVETDFDTAASQTPEDLDISEHQQQLDRLEASIRGLGEVNHAAIKDYETESERREKLDAQHREIQQAIDTLEAAIQKIDRETKNLFQETFDKLNTQLQRIFPDMLGGGSARLELTSNDLLRSGVQIVARPPGKKNATIAMLSGGEKAMTAISLVLALFSLNPAPFCVLDEVDAPLDDHNVVRFVTTIQKISAQVQCILITHSKITMEYMDSLLGVTMGEPGVSRIVSVDMDSAMKMVV